MPDLRVDKGGSAKLDIVDGDLTVGKGARITAKGKLVTVTGHAHFESDAEVDCDFQSDSLSVERGALKVTGDLTVIKGMDVAHTVRVGGTVRAGKIEVGGKLFAGSVSCGGQVTVGGIVEVSSTLEADSLDVGGKAIVRGAVTLKDLGVGGLADVGGGSITGRAKVGGIFQSRGPLLFGDLQVYGKCELPAGCKGKRIATSGKLSVKGDLDCEEVDVGGLASMGGDCKSKTVTINGKLEVRGSLAASGTLDNFGYGEVKGDFTGGALHVGGKFRAHKAVVEDSAEIAGEIVTDVGTKAKTVLVGSGSRCGGPLVGGRVELSKSKMVMADWTGHWAGQVASLRLIGRMTNAEDVYGDEVVLGPNTRCRHIFARTVDLSPGCVVDEVTYTEELHKEHAPVHLTRPSEKVNKLPPFPL